VSSYDDVSRWRGMLRVLDEVPMSGGRQRALEAKPWQPEERMPERWEPQDEDDPGVWAEVRADFAGAARWLVDVASHAVWRAAVAWWRRSFEIED